MEEGKCMWKEEAVVLLQDAWLQRAARLAGHVQVLEKVLKEWRTTISGRKTWILLWPMAAPMEPLDLRVNLQRKSPGGIGFPM